MSREINLFKEHLETVETDSGDFFDKEVKQIIEALLFSSSEPLPLHKIKEVLESRFAISPAGVRKCIEGIREDWKKEKRGFQIDEIAHGYLLRTVEEANPFLELLYRDRRGEKLSKAAMEVLAIVAYKQPITRAGIDKIRGVDSSGSLYSLMERGLIEVTGKLDLPGRPSQYGVTKQFLKHFGLKSIDELSRVFPV